MLRPIQALWFEALVARDDVPQLLEALARTTAVELEPRPGRAGATAVESDLAPALQQYADLQQHYSPYWPAPVYTPSAVAPPSAVLARCLDGLRAWSVAAEPDVRALQSIERERSELLLWWDVLEQLAGQAFDFEMLATAGPLLAARLLVFPDDRLPALPPDLLVTRVDVRGKAHAILIGRADEVVAACRQASVYKAQIHDPPLWLRGTAETILTYARDRLAALDTEAARLRAQLDALHEQHDIKRTLGEVSCLQWYAQHATALETGELFSWVTGWTSDRDAIARVARSSGARALVNFPPAPARLMPPVLLRNPWLLRPFEVFSRALGMPGQHEADPTPVLALAVPLLFGYMFGDVGQGLVLIAAGLLLQRRWPIARLLVAGGASAIAFGVLFGSVFAYEDLLPALWLHPLDAPLTVVAVPLVGGTVLLAAGLCINAAECFWRGEWREWLATDAALLATYIGLMSAFLAPAALWLALAGGVWFVAGSAVIERRLAALATALLTLVEKTVQILINTLSFVRVGAFALAHAGLSSAVIALAATAETAAVKALIFVLGNVAIIVLEALVVSIQTTRLVLFEFFTRFVFGAGRVFRPLPPPPFASQET